MKNNVKRSRLMHAANYLKKNNPVILKGQPIGASRALKYAWWFESFRDQLRNGLYRFSYFKKDGTIREACGTLNPAFIPAEHLPKGTTDSSSTRNIHSSIFNYYDLHADGDTGGWRSFCLDLFIGFVELVPVENVLHRIDDQDLIDECDARGYHVSGL